MTTKEPWDQHNPQSQVQASEPAKMATHDKTRPSRKSYKKSGFDTLCQKDEHLLWMPCQGCHVTRPLGTGQHSKAALNSSTSNIPGPNNPKPNAASGNERNPAVLGNTLIGNGIYVWSTVRFRKSISRHHFQIQENFIILISNTIKMLFIVYSTTFLQKMCFFLV